MDTTKVPLIKDIAMASPMPSLIENRLAEIESKFEGFEARFMENEKLKQDYSELKEHITRLNNHMEETEIKLRDAYANIIVLEAENKRLTDELKTVNDSGDVLPTRPSSSPRTDGAEGVDDVNDIVSPVSGEDVMVNAGGPQDRLHYKEEHCKNQINSCLGVKKIDSTTKRRAL